MKKFRIKLAVEFEIEASDYFDPGWVEDQCGKDWIDRFLIPKLKEEEAKGICNCARYEYLGVTEIDNPESDEHE